MKLIKACPPCPFCNRTGKHAVNTKDTTIGRILTAEEIDIVSGGMLGAVSGTVHHMANTVGHFFAAGGVCDYHWQSGRTYCYFDALGPDSAFFIN